MSEYSSVEKLIEIQGEDRGRIKNNSLAWIGAEREEEIRHQQALNKIEYICSCLTAGERVFATPYKDQKDQIQRRSEEEGELAMARDVQRDEYNTLIREGFDKKLAKKLAIKKRKKFLDLLASTED